MIKRTIKETRTEYDKDGKMTSQTITETTEDDDTDYSRPLYQSGLTWGPDCNYGSRMSVEPN